MIRGSRVVSKVQGERTLVEDGQKTLEIEVIG